MNWKAEEVTVRDATLDDADGLAEIHVAGFETAHRGLIADRALEERTPELRRRIWHERLSAHDRDDFVLVAEHGGAVVGFASVRPATEDEIEGAEGIAYWENLYIEPRLIGTPVAHLIVQAAFARLRERGYRFAVAYVAAGNERLLRYAERVGWSVDGASRETEGGRELRIRGQFDPHPEQQ